MLGVLTGEATPEAAEPPSYEAAPAEAADAEAAVPSYEADPAAAAEPPREADLEPAEPGVPSYEADPAAAAAAADGSDDGGTPAGEAPADATAPEDPLSTSALEEAVLDEACVTAVDLARAAALEEAGPAVGAHLGAQGEPFPLGAGLVTHLFATTDRAYSGWRWAVTVARAEGSDVVTVDEVVLLPGPDALLPPAWVPYSERVQPGDLSPGDVLPPAPDDLRIVPAHADPETELDAALLDEAFLELGLGRPRVMSREGRADAAERWWNGDAGPLSPLAKAAPADCGTCAFLVPLSGSLRAAFGACANEYAPDDGRVVALTHGCGAHSEVPFELTHVAQSGMAVEHEELEVVVNDPTETEPEPEPEHVPTPGDPSDEGLSEDESESLGHS